MSLLPDFGTWNISQSIDLDLYLEKKVNENPTTPKTYWFGRCPVLRGFALLLQTRLDVIKGLLEQQ